MDQILRRAANTGTIRPLSKGRQTLTDLDFADNIAVLENLPTLDRHDRTHWQSGSGS